MERPDLLLSGHLDGFCIRYRGEIVDVFPDYEGAVVGMRASRAALTQLDATLTDERKDA